MSEHGRDYDFDWIVVGSGFGGSVCALRLAEKGYRVAVLECGREFSDSQLPTSAWQLPRFLRTGCLRCRDCMMGCPHGAKNTLPRNYLWFARRRGVEIHAERTVTDVRPLCARSMPRANAWPT